MLDRHTQRGRIPRNPWHWLPLAALMVAFACHAAPESPIKSITVKYEGDAYLCDAVMFAPVKPALAWAVLTDFEHMADWVPNVKESKVLKTEDTTLTIEQRGQAKFGAASFPYVTERRMEITKPVSIKSTQIKGSLRRVESLMKVEPEGNGTRLVYHLEIVPSLLAATVMSKSFLEHEVTEQFTAIVGEMVRRAQ